MKCIVIYFSQTGNTEKVAKAIQAGVKNAAGNCDLVKIKDANPRRLYEYDLIGLGSPMLPSGPEPGDVTGNVSAFINNMRFVGGKHIFVFCTHGTLPDFFFPNIVPQLKRRGLVVIGMRDWYASVYLTLGPKPYPTDGHPDEIDLEEAKDFGRETVENSRRISGGETGLIPPVPVSKIMRPMQETDLSTSAGKIPEFASVLKYHNEKCVYPKCRLCMENCPVDGIDLTVNPFVLAKPCISCEFCTKICPTGALEADDYYQKYAPLGASEELQARLLPHLAEAEAEGHFRRLVPVEKIGWNTYFYQIYKKHPKWIIGKGPV